MLVSIPAKNTAVPLKIQQKCNTARNTANNLKVFPQVFSPRATSLYIAQFKMDLSMTSNQ